MGKGGEVSMDSGEERGDGWSDGGEELEEENRDGVKITQGVIKVEKA